MAALAPVCKIAPDSQRTEEEVVKLKDPDAQNTSTVPWLQSSRQNCLVLVICKGNLLWGLPSAYLVIMVLVIKKTLSEEHV